MINRRLRIALILSFLLMVVWTIDCNRDTIISPVKDAQEEWVLIEPLEIPDPTLPELGSSYRGVVSWYGYESCTNPRCLTASGEVFDELAYTAACNPPYPLGSRFRVDYLGNSVVVRCNDRGGFGPLGRGFDLSRGAFEALAPLSKGILEVEITLL